MESLGRKATPQEQGASGVATDWQEAEESVLPEAPPSVERALRIAPVSEGSPAAREHWAS